MMANHGCNSPILHRGSVFKEDSVEREEEYQFTKDKVIGELTSRMKKLPKGHPTGFDKNKRGESDDLTIPSFNSYRRRLDSTNSQDAHCSSPIPCAVTEAVTTAEISPQRTSVASIQLCPSPLVQRRRNQSQSPQRRMNRVAHPSSYHTTNGISISSTARRNPTSAVPSNVRPTRPTTARSISVQSSVRGRDSSQNGPRKPPTISATGSNGSTRTLNGSTRTLNGSTRNLNGSTKSISGSTRSINGSARPLNGSSRNLAASNRNLAPARPAMNRSVSADPRLDDPEIQAKLGNRATKVVQKSLGACGVCSKAINEDGCTAFGKFYHKTCFKCTVCRQKITGKFFEKNGKPYCAKDFQDPPPPSASSPNPATRPANPTTSTNPLPECHGCQGSITNKITNIRGRWFHPECIQCELCFKPLEGIFYLLGDKLVCRDELKQLQESCTVCKLPIKGDSVVSNDKPFHPECMKCFICGDSLRGQFLTFQDKPICERDYKLNADKCSICGEVPMGKFFSADGEIRCEKCHDDESEKCLKCREPVVGKVIKINCGSSYHPDCFACQVCKKSLVNLPFVSDDKHQIYCPEDWNKKKAAKCAFCKKAIVPKNGQKTASRLRAMGKDYHPECFQCEDCNLVLDSKDRFSQCYPYKNHVLCYKCNRKKLSSSESECDDDDDEE